MLVALFVLAVTFPPALGSSQFEPRMREFPDLHGMVAAYGDFNSDKFTDLFLITDEGRCFEIAHQLPDRTEDDKDVCTYDAQTTGRS